MEKKYGKLLDRFMIKENSKDYNRMLDREKQKCRDEEQSRYGDLLKNVNPDLNRLNMMVNLENDRNIRKKKEAEEDRKRDIDRRRRIEDEKQKHEERVAKNSAFVNDFLEKKRTKQEMKNRQIQEKNKRKAVEQKIYKDIDKLMNIDPKLADAYVGVIANVRDK